MNAVMRLPSRRLISQLLCRLPLMALWTLVVIFILFKWLSMSHRDVDLSSIDNQQLNRHKSIDKASNPNQYQLLDQPSRLIYRTRESTIESSLSKQSKLGTTTTIPPDKIHSTTRRTVNQLVRESKVFILIVQEGNSTPLKLARSLGPAGRPAWSSKYSVIQYGPRDRQIVVPAHVRVLVDILESHKINFEIDTTRNGLPASLLTDENNNSGKARYSVIIVDDFIRYTRLDRWTRDQLDRHCRSKHIGIISYMNPDSVNDIQYVSKHTIDVGDNLNSSGEVNMTSEDSLADQFPFTFRTVDQQSCRNSSSDSCLVDHQLNDQSLILRLLRRKPNFILNGPLPSNLHDSPWVIMSSNHVTYEPLTWARFRHPTRAGQRKIDKNPVAPGTRGEDHILPIAEVVHDGSKPDEDSAYEDPAAEQSKGDDDWLTSSSVDNDSVSNVHDTNSDTVKASDEAERQVLSMYDRGQFDGIKRVIFGGFSQHWLNRVLLLDAIEHLSAGRILSPLDRYIQIDIDDIFVGERGKRMNASDVDALIEVQKDFAMRVDGGFKFNLGFSGKYFKHGDKHENTGDERLISRANEFTWFCHFWSHSKAHLFNDTHSLAEELRKNLKFAQAHSLPIVGHTRPLASNSEPQSMPPTYAVAPHHSGVYPVHEQLYEVWRDVLNVQVTSTEEYPHLKPANGRKGFVYKTIKVLPRQTCGLYTHTIFRKKYPGGIKRLESSIRGGELFETILHNPVNIYMTHMSNYANDRLALYTFTALLDFVQSNTNIQLRYAASSREVTSGETNQNQLGPARLADHYFNLFPDQAQPLWTDPCSDRRHLDIWSSQKQRDFCSLLPKLVIVGPQKTGTTALFSYLKINPIFRSSLMSPTDYEEIQFFNDKHYNKGVDWYMSRFMELRGGGATRTNSSDELIYLDKSATYFDDPKVPQRASSLLPTSRIVILLVNPVDRAYSWYQHMKAHGDKVAISLSFEHVIMGRDVEPELRAHAKALRDRCLHPGYYSQHLNKWLEHYSSNQIIIIDGQWFKLNPASVLNRLQSILRVQEPIDYNRHLVFSPEKGFYCQRDQLTGQVHCLGKSKGRRYEPMSQEARHYLNKLYWPYNRQLARLLSDIGQPLPIWLDETMSFAQASSVIY